MREFQRISLSFVRKPAHTAHQKPRSDQTFHYAAVGFIDSFLIRDAAQRPVVFLVNVDERRHEHPLDQALLLERAFGNDRWVLRVREGFQSSRIDRARHPPELDVISETKLAR